LALSQKLGLWSKSPSGKRRDIDSYRFSKIDIDSYRFSKIDPDAEDQQSDILNDGIHDQKRVRLRNFLIQGEMILNT